MRRVSEATINDLLWCFERIETGTAATPRQIRRVELAAQHLAEWTSERMPTSETRGGSSSPVETEDRIEDRQVAAFAIVNRARMATIVKDLERLTRELREIVVRSTATVDHTRLPPAPGCRSCARVEGVGARKIGGHFAAVMPPRDQRGLDGRVVRGCREAARQGLCRACWDFARAQAIQEAGEQAVVLEKHWPPVKWCDLRHSQSERAAGCWWAKQIARAS